MSSGGWQPAEGDARRHPGARPQPRRAVRRVGDAAGPDLRGARSWIGRRRRRGMSPVRAARRREAQGSAGLLAALVGRHGDTASAFELLDRADRLADLHSGDRCASTAVAERRLRRRGRQHRLRAQRPFAGAVERRRHDAGRAERSGLGMDQDGRAGRCCRACSIRRRAIITSSNNEIDRGVGGHDHPRLGGAIPRDAPDAIVLRAGEGVELDAMARAAERHDRASARRACWPGCQAALEAAKTQDAEASRGRRR